MRKDLLDDQLPVSGDPVQLFRWMIYCLLLSITFGIVSETALLMLAAPYIDDITSFNEEPILLLGTVAGIVKGSIFGILLAICLMIFSLEHVWTFPPGLDLPLFALAVVGEILI